MLGAGFLRLAQRQQAKQSSAGAAPAPAPHPPHGPRGAGSGSGRGRPQRRWWLALVVALQLALCGAFLLRRPPGAAPEASPVMSDTLSHALLLEATNLAADGSIQRAFLPERVASAAGVQSFAVKGKPKRRIPSIIHQTYPTGQVPEEYSSMVQSWRRLNPDWEVRLYTDEECLRFVERQFPEYLAAYRSLGHVVQQSDFFRYLVVLHSGGLYADIDTECRQPLSHIIHKDDSLVVGWENEFQDEQEMLDRNYVRPRQVLQWVFAGEAGHPALQRVCDFIAANRNTTFSTDFNRDTLERTGPGAFTDAVLGHMRAPGHTAGGRWPVRVLPKIDWGVLPFQGLEPLSPEDPAISVQHFFAGSWRKGPQRGRFQGLRDWWDEASGKKKRLRDALAMERVNGLNAAEQAAAAATQLFPVSAAWEPPFTSFVHLKGHGDQHAGRDVSLEVSVWGSWQPVIASSRSPSLADILVGALDHAPDRPPAMLLDVGSCYGALALAAASRGHHAIAVETGNRSFSALQASLAHNGWPHLITPHLLPGPGKECRGGNASRVAACAQAWAARVGALVPRGAPFSAVRLAADGAEGWVLDALMGSILRHPPRTLVVELQPFAPATQAYGGPVQLLQRLHNMGYSAVSHAGVACDRRWQRLVETYASWGGRRGGARAVDLKQPTWCKLQPDAFASLDKDMVPGVPEIILFGYEPGREVAHRLA